MYSLSSTSSFSQYRSYTVNVTTFPSHCAPLYQRRHHRPSTSHVNVIILFPLDPASHCRLHHSVHSLSSLHHSVRTANGQHCSISPYIVPHSHLTCYLPRIAHLHRYPPFVLITVPLSRTCIYTSTLFSSFYNLFGPCGARSSGEGCPVTNASVRLLMKRASNARWAVWRRCQQAVQWR
jgi:hypothetical protein